MRAGAPRKAFHGFLRLRQVRNFHASRAVGRQENGVELSRTRNIGIIAHIDAGKTTTTERMLYYSGHTRRIGNVDEGSTVTDFLPAERARGITIQSAAITLHWPPRATDDSVAGDSVPSLNNQSHRINLIDTPGHADFTFEVVRSLRVLDGAICILDGVAGVEAQTEKVWIQADHHQIPRLLYVNKLDRNGASFRRTVRDIASRLHVWPAVCQIPWFDGAGKLIGLADVVGLRALKWVAGSDGRVIESIPLQSLKSHDTVLAMEIAKAREALVEILSEFDDQLVESFLDNDQNHLAISEHDMLHALRRCTLHDPQRVVPVVIGASLKNIGVQPLLDCVNRFLPAPSDRPSPKVQLDQAQPILDDVLSGEAIKAYLEAQKSRSRKAKNLATRRPMALVQSMESLSLAFKVVNDAKRGVLVYVRVYSGALSRNSNLYNTNLKLVEKATRLLEMYASDAVDVPQIQAGQIGVIVGLKHARTGDTLLGHVGRASVPPPIDSLQLQPIVVPPPVFFVSLEPQSLSAEKQLAEALAILLREDPSLSVSTDNESGQTHLAGMGELHLEIATDRLINDLKAVVSVGKIEIGYREAIIRTSQVQAGVYDREIAGKRSKASCSVVVAPRQDEDLSNMSGNDDHTVMLPDENLLTIRMADEFDARLESGSDNPSTLTLPSVIQAARNGVTAALARGPKMSYPLYGVHVQLSFDQASLSSDTTLGAISGAARSAASHALKNSVETSGFVLMEPLMLVAIDVNEESMGPVVHDLSSARSGQVMSLDLDEPQHDASSDSDFVVDMRRVYTPPDPFGDNGTGTESIARSPVGGRRRNITAKVPLREMVGYLKTLRSLTKGRGSFTMAVDTFERMTPAQQKRMLAG
ncbi:elongation factor G [Eremomyces bilateralis CBS 781.70]|uniref:Ribosome-releasing factor 2, mitochondrial n=1 Tax=Eremomyces bilateralis CBS 781.70 TaxID=1392243 RepID=A0A6G1G3E2_9PEZI|nr:elongation factor G [Eremomyces bilateralis CBS 781.70]KAF1812625.1 elongation factor G [Eremomyces bilateralis CBS 781.70]